ncbi:unnamed protein product [Linum tenue]|uniref:non-specific serine/threonine protein kinase n=1 Tax=Linum tenue TaxID=586396 RepID=A0AAV0R0W2_9ROSI|nr:unnamed protein product [Linum tenue]
MISSYSSGGGWVFAAAVVVALLQQLCFLTTTTAVASRIILSNETDRMALLEFKSKILGDPLGALSSWNDSTHFCRWYGVSCSKRHLGRVQVLDLHSEKLSGSISPHIGNLSFLKKLVLLNNSLSGGIPSEIGRLRRLHELRISENSLEGEIPSNISGCSVLTIFNVSRNKLAGQLPWQLGSLSKLQFFAGAYNNLTGSIPHSFGNLSSLVKFHVVNNHLSGRIPDSLGQLKSVLILNMVINNLHGEIPASIFNLSSLLTLAFGFNQLHGSLPKNLGISLPNLQWLDVTDNQFSGSVPASLSNASNLVILQLAVNNFTGSMPSMRSSHKLVNLIIDGNSLGSVKANDLSFLSSLTNVSSLKVVEIYKNYFGGSLPEQIGNLSKNLETLNVASNALEGSIPSGVQNLVNLQWLDARNNKLTGTIPSVIGNMQALRLLNLRGNRISGSIPPTFGNLTELIDLDLDENNLWGEIPLGFENCRNLLYVELAYNNLSGVIPPQIVMSSSSLIYLNLSHNHLIGALPAEVGGLVNLEILDLSHNMLSGEIPTSLGSCAVLGSLYLQDNLLQGIIPSSLGSLRGIEVLDISSNNLSGQIPKSFEEMKLLQLLNLSYNNLEGEVPSSGVFWNDSIISVVGNDKLCGGMAELNLPHCSFKQKKKTLLSHKSIKIVVLVVTGLLCLAFMGSCLLIFWFMKRGKQDALSVDDSQLILSYYDLHKATDGFSATNLIGVGSFGSVYKGFIEANGIGSTIAVKVFNLQRNGASRSFMAECAALKNIRHRNLLRILTVCSGVDYQMDDFKALIYEFLANGSLEEWLHPVGSSIDEPPRILSFLQRLNVAIDVATAMDYLHHQSGTPIVHCDLKPNNVLLDMDMVAHVGDFGLARFLQTVVDPSPPDHASSSIGVKGTVGYAPPEYGMGNKVSIQGDVYSYGVLLLEIFTGRRPTNEIFKNGLSLHGFVGNALSEKLIAKVVDPILLNELSLGQATHSYVNSSSNNSEEANYNKSHILEEALISILEIGVACSPDSPDERISMSEVVTRLVSLKRLLRDKLARRRMGGR